MTNPNTQTAPLQVQFTTVSYDQFLNDLSAKVLQAIDDKKKQDEDEDKYVSPEVVRNMFDPKISRVTLHNWTTQGKLIPYSIGGKKLYKLIEVREAIKSLKKYSRTDL